MLKESLRVVRKLATLGGREWAELFRAQGMLIAAQVLVWTRPTGHFIARSEQPAAAQALPPAEHSRSEASRPEAHRTAARSMEPRRIEPQGMEARSADAQRIALAVGRAAEYGVFRPLCLARSVALQRMLEAHGIRGSQIKIGVRRKGNELAAHAWVQYGDRVLGDTPSHVGSFAQLANVSVVPKR